MPNRIQSDTPPAPALLSDEAFNPVFCTRELLRSLRFGALATLQADGTPFTSLVNIASGIDGTPLTLISELAVHTKNIARDSRMSLLIAQPAGANGANDPAAHPRISLTGRAEITTDAHDRRRFLARHPLAAKYADFPDFAFYRLVPDHIHVVAGFGRIASVSPRDALSEPVAAAQIAGIEQSAIDHLNADHTDALALYATVLAQAPPGAWQATGIDAEGIDLFNGSIAARAWYPQPLTEGGQLRTALAALAAAAREKSGLPARE